MFATQGTYHHLIHILRCLNLAGHKQGELSVFGHEWEFQGVMPSYFECGHFWPLFPELDPFCTTKRISGVRLMERSALAYEFHESVLVRYSRSDPKRVDVHMTLDLGNHIVVKTEDEYVFNTLDDYFQLTSSESHRNCFR